MEEVLAQAAEKMHVRITKVQADRHEVHLRERYLVHLLQAQIHAQIHTRVEAVLLQAAVRQVHMEEVAAEVVVAADKINI